MQTGTHTMPPSAICGWLLVETAVSKSCLTGAPTLIDAEYRAPSYRGRPDHEHVMWHIWLVVAPIPPYDGIRGRPTKASAARSTDVS
jgi:hypothetical protein